MIYREYGCPSPALSSAHTPRLHFSCTSAAPRLHFGCTFTALRLHLCCPVPAPPLHTSPQPFTGTAAQTLPPETLSPRQATLSPGHWKYTRLRRGSSAAPARLQDVAVVAETSPSELHGGMRASEKVVRGKGGLPVAPWAPCGSAGARALPARFCLSLIGSLLVFIGAECGGRRPRPARLPAQCLGRAVVAAARLDASRHDAVEVAQRVTTVAAACTAWRRRNKTAAVTAECGASAPRWSRIYWKHSAARGWRLEAGASACLARALCVLAGRWGLRGQRAGHTGRPIIIGAECVHCPCALVRPARPGQPSRGSQVHSTDSSPD